MQCPNCGCKHIFATHTFTIKITVNGNLTEGIRRRRKCRHCSRIFQTFEKLEEDPDNEDETPFNPFIKE